MVEAVGDLCLAVVAPGVASNEAFVSKAGTDSQARSRKALTCPTITDIFQREPLRSRRSAIRTGGFSWNPLTLKAPQRDPPARSTKASPSSIQPYSTSGVLGCAPNDTRDPGRSSAIAKAVSKVEIN